MPDRVHDDVITPAANCGASRASCFYVGRVAHRRFAPMAHRLDYDVYMTYLDLAEVDDVFDGRWLWSTSRSAPFRFDRADHFGERNSDLSRTVRDLVEDRIGRRPEGPIRLLTNLRHFGYVFNPVSFYYCFDADDSLEAVVAEVHNTPWNEEHLYVLDARSSPNATGFTAEHAKEFHVSPFFEMELRYRWQIGLPGERLTMHIASGAEQELENKVFDATLALRRIEIDGPSCAQLAAKFPLMTLKVIAGIHWEAVKLWFKGAPLHLHPGGVRADSASGADRARQKTSEAS